MADFFDVLGAKKEGYSDQEIADYLAQQSGFNILDARKEGYNDKEIISHLNKTGQGAGYAFMKNFSQGVGSELRGLGQMLGAEPSTVDESLARQLESESPIAGTLGRIVGGFVNPSSIVPGSIGSKVTVGGTVAAGALSGGIGGALDPTYEKEDSRLLNAAVGVGLGGALGAVFGILGHGKVTKELADSLITKAREAGAKTEEEIAAWVKTYGAKEVKATEATLPTPTPNEPNVQAMDSIESIAQFKPTLDSMDSAARQTVEDAITKGAETGDYSAAIKTVKDYTTEVELGKSPIWKIKDILSEDNPFYAKNLAALRDMNLEHNANGIKLMQSKFDEINALRLADTAELPPVNEALKAFLGRNIGEVLPLNYQHAVIPWLDKQLANFSDTDIFYRDLLKAGVPERDALILVRDSTEQFLNAAAQVMGNRSQAARITGDKGTVKLFGSLRGMMKMLDTGAARGLDDEATMSMIDTLSKLRMDSANGTIDFNKAAASLANKMQEYKPTTGQKFSELITNIYTSGLQTAAVNAWSPPVKMLLNGIENTILTLTPGSSRFLDFKRSGAAFSALLDSFKEASYFAKAGFLEGKSVSQPGSMEDIAGAIGKHMVGGKNVSPMWEQKAGQGIRMIGSNPSVGIDEFFKTYFRKMSLYDSYHQIAYSGKFKGREQEVYNALKKINTSGRNWTEKLSSVDIPGISKSDLKDVAQKAIDYAKLNTFQADLGKFGNDLLRIKSNNPAAALVIPFVKTPINILKEGLSYTPLGLIPGMSPERIVRKNGRIVRDELGRPLVKSYLTNEQKYARTAMGIGAATLIATHVGNNEITGAYPKDPGKRAAMQAAGIPEYSLKIGDKWIPYGRIEPLATALGTVVDSITHYGEMKAKNPKDVKDGEYAKQVISVLSNNFVNKTFLQGLSGALQAVNDPERYGDSYIKGFASLAVPGVVAQFAKAQDPYARVNMNFAEAVQNRIPGQRMELPVQTNIIGATIENPSYGAAAFTGLPIRSTEQTPVQAKLAELKVDYAPVDKTFKGVQLNGEQYARYQAISGDMVNLKIEGLVQSAAFNNMPLSLQKYVLEKKMKEGRVRAGKILQGELLQDPEFRAEFIRQKLKKKGIEEE